MGHRVLTDLDWQPRSAEEAVTATAPGQPRPARRPSPPSVREEEDI